MLPHLYKQTFMVNDFFPSFMTLCIQALQAGDLNLASNSSSSYKYSSD